jgi:hypothetical protein|eukprot:CAMPEP_0174311568 /NCGR_PEP_ID=MMETSP0810-20121108/3780_1 /TAXON_ID=73025 ORGANISM="Eutreptiella gymnastica-like, Strain CCMP1594" /NCGR_SAMPLE_ID=MMETSP0810 /ASSEMBLY_ACC=CAM_ASM_000659 /LENGTH=80 /DNA_ID=CAMNT_0015419811 /DNA_START=225 /DNA_END=467 /DNA_ORIENTATION=+
MNSGIIEGWSMKVTYGGKGEGAQLGTAAPVVLIWTEVGGQRRNLDQGWAGQGLSEPGGGRGSIFNAGKSAPVLQGGGGSP